MACVMFAGNRSGLNFKMTEGMSVVVFGSVSVYERDGRYQLYAREIIQEGVGNLYRAFEALKKKLLAEGLFDEAHKKLIPAYPRTLGVVTAKTGAAVQDIMNVARRRNPWIQIVFYPAQVQGEGAAQSVVRGIQALEEYGVDVMIVGRGGGSIEDLWAFNEEIVARAVYDCSVPIISAVGHETDTTIIDYVSDLRAPTPSAAAELAVTDMRIVLGQIDAYTEALDYAMQDVIDRRRERLAHYEQIFRHLSPKSRLTEKRQRLSETAIRLEMLMENSLSEASNRMAVIAGRLDGLSPLKQLERGYAYVSDQEGHGISHIEQVEEGSQLNIAVTDGELTAEVIDIRSVRRE